MADNRKRFSPQEMGKITKSGALAFVAAVFGVTEADLATQHRRSSGVISGPSTTKQGRRDIVGRLQALSDTMFAEVQEKGFVKILGQAWGITEKRAAQLRASNYSDQRVAAVTEEETGRVSGSVFHSHDGRKSHRISITHRN